MLLLHWPGLTCERSALLLVMMMLIKAAPHDINSERDHIRSCCGDAFIQLTLLRRVAVLTDFPLTGGGTEMKRLAVGPGTLQED